MNLRVSEDLPTPPGPTTIILWTSFGRGTERDLGDEIALKQQSIGKYGNYELDRAA